MYLPVYRRVRRDALQRMAPVKTTCVLLSSAIPPGSNDPKGATQGPGRAQVARGPQKQAPIRSAKVRSERNVASQFMQAVIHIRPSNAGIGGIDGPCI